MNAIIYGAPFGITYSLFIHKLTDVILGNAMTNEKYQTKILILFLSGVLALILACTIFTYNKKYRNSAIKTGFIIGAMLLILYSVFTNWDKVNDDTKLIMSGFSLVGISWYLYNYRDDQTK